MVSIIVIEYFSLDDIKKCLDSVTIQCTDIEYEVIVSSNSCYPIKRQTELMAEMPDVRWSFNQENGGFAYGMNQGLKIAKGDYYLLMNPDVSLTESISPLYDFLDSHRDVGAVSPQILGHDGSVQDSCRDFVTPSRFFLRQFKRIFFKHKSSLNRTFDYSRTQTVDWVIGAFIMVPKNTYDIIGPLNEGYFMYAEDLEWCTRIWQAGYKVVYLPRVHIEYEGTRKARTKLKYALIFLCNHLKYWYNFGIVQGYPKREIIIYD